VGVLIVLTAFAVYAASALDGRLKDSRAAVMAFLFLMLGQVAIGAAVVLSGLYFLTAALHLAVALAMLYLLSQRWAVEVKKTEVVP
jgi:heme A synthase